MRKLKKVRSAYLIVTAMLVLAFCTMQVKAEEIYQLQQVTTNEDKVIAYIKGNEKPEQIDYQIATTPCDSVTYGTISDMGETIHTIILMDNSLSISEDNKSKAIEFLRQYIEFKDEKEEISIATFGEDIQFLQRKSTDKDALLSAIDSIEFNNQDTYLTDILFNLLDEIKEDSTYTRFLVISDGVDNKPIGITKEELLDKLKENLHPVYTLGHIYKENQTELENMFALSRITHGQEFLLDDMNDITELTSQLMSDNNLICIEAEVPEPLRDGSTRNSLFTIHTDDGEYDVTAQVTMPFSIQITEELEPVVEDKPEETATEVIEEEILQEEEPIEEEPIIEEPETVQNVHSNMFKIVAVLVIVAAGISLCIILKKKDKKAEKEGQKRTKTISKTTPLVPLQVPLSDQVPLYDQRPVSGEERDQEGTVLLDGRYLLVLRDQKSPDKIFKYPLDTKVIVGRNVDKVNIAIDYSKTISGQHCEFSVRNNRFFIKDLQSVNHTYLNDVMIHTETELSSGNKVRIGEVELCVEFIPI